MSHFQFAHPVTLIIFVEASRKRSLTDAFQPLHSEPVIIASVDGVKLEGFLLLSYVWKLLMSTTVLCIKAAMKPNPTKT